MGNNNNANANGVFSIGGMVLQKQMKERNEIRNIGQIEEIGEELSWDLQKVRSWEKKCGSCNLVHRGDCW